MVNSANERLTEIISSLRNDLEKSKQTMEESSRNHNEEMEAMKSSLYALESEKNGSMEE